MPPDCSPGPVYTAGGSAASVQQTPLPITLSGTVFEDLNADNKQEAGDPGIAGVTLTLYELDEAATTSPPERPPPPTPTATTSSTASCPARIKWSKPSRTAT